MNHQIMMMIVMIDSQDPCFTRNVVAELQHFLLVWWGWLRWDWGEVALAPIMTIEASLGRQKRSRGQSSDGEKIKYPSFDIQYFSDLSNDCAVCNCAFLGLFLLPLLHNHREELKSRIQELWLLSRWEHGIDCMGEEAVSYMYSGSKMNRFDHMCTNWGGVDDDGDD